MQVHTLYVAYICMHIYTQTHIDCLFQCWPRFADGKKYYKNPYTLEVSIQFPVAKPAARGGILADEMGMGIVRPSPSPSPSPSFPSSRLSASSALGKTIETIALVCANTAEVCAAADPNDKEASTHNGCTLVVCTMSLLAQWRDEFLEKSDLSVDCVYGNSRHSQIQKAIKHNNVLITTYGTVTSEANDVENSAIFNTKWFRIVLDEAHHIKNRSTATAKAAFLLDAYSRWCLTGTPIHNSLWDMYSLLRFLGEEPWCNVGWWRHMIDSPFRNGSEAALQRLQAIMQPLLLRRTKASKDKHGKLLVELPHRTEHVFHASFSRPEL